MKKRLFALFLIQLCLSGLFVSCTSEEETFNSTIKYEESFYAPPNVQEYVYKLAQDESCDHYFASGENLDKESIAPIYYVDKEEYARTGNFELKRANEYCAKIVDKNGEYVHNACLWYETLDNSLRIHGEDIETDINESYSYADHAEQFKEIFGDNLSVNEVKVARCFYKTCFIIDKYDSPLFVFFEGIDLYSGKNKVHIKTLDDMKYSFIDLLEDEELYKTAVERWENEHPGEKFVGGKYTGTDIEISSSANNIIDIYDYLGLEYEITEEIKVYDNVESWIALACGGLVVVAVVAVEIILYRKKKKARDAACVSEAKEE